MSRYLKILVITLFIQIFCFTLFKVLSTGQNSSLMADKIGTVFFFAAIPVSIITDIVLAVMWGTNIKEKLTYIFLMPTNYTWIIVLVFFIRFVKGVGKILHNIPANFG